jgi:hypothetical protein
MVYRALVGAELKRVYNLGYAAGRRALERQTIGQEQQEIRITETSEVKP